MSSLLNSAINPNHPLTAVAMNTISRYPGRVTMLLPVFKKLLITRNMNTIERIHADLAAFDEQVAAKRAILVEQTKAELIHYIIARFEQVSYRDQCISLGGSPFDNGGEDYAGSRTPSKHFHCIGIQQDWDPKKGWGEVRFYVERKRRYRAGEKFGAYRLEPGTQLTMEELDEIATCLQQYGQPCFTTGLWMHYGCLS